MSSKLSDVTNSKNYVWNISNILSDVQPILENNEDIIAAVVENIQLSRLDDSLHHYNILQNNLILLATELDNYPPSDIDLYSDFIIRLNVFPDEIMRKDILDDLLPCATSNQSSNISCGACSSCASKKISDKVCRIDLRHVDPPNYFSNTEKCDFVKVAQAMASAFQNEDSSLTKNSRTNESTEPKTKTKQYRRWQASEIHSLLIAVSIFGFADFKRLSACLEDRNPSMVRAFLQKNFTRQELTGVMNGCIPSAPKGYTPNPSLANAIRYLKSHSNPLASSSTTFGDINGGDPAARPRYSTGIPNPSLSSPYMHANLAPHHQYQQAIHPSISSRDLPINILRTQNPEIMHPSSSSVTVMTNNMNNNYQINNSMSNPRFMSLAPPPLPMMTKMTPILPSLPQSLLMSVPMPKDAPLTLINPLAHMRGDEAAYAPEGKIQYNVRGHSRRKINKGNPK